MDPTKFGLSLMLIIIVLKVRPISSSLEAELKDGTREGFHFRGARNRRRKPFQMKRRSCLEFKFVRNVYSQVLIEHCGHHLLAFITLFM